MKARGDPIQPFPTQAGNTVFRICFISFVFALIILEFPGSHELLHSPHSGIQTQNLVIQNVRVDSPNRDANLRAGDEIVAIDGERLRNQHHYHYLLSTNRAFHPQNYTLQRDGQQLQVIVHYGPVPDSMKYQRFAFLLVAGGFLLVGLWVYLRRSDLLGSLFGLNCVFLAFFLSNRASVSSPMLQLMGELFHDAVIAFFPAVFLHFFLVFPDRVAQDGERPSARKLFLVYAAPCLLYALTVIMIVHRFTLRPVDPALLNAVLAVSALYFVGYLIASMVIFIRRYRCSSAAQKQKLRIVIVGIVLGILPLSVTTIIRQVEPAENTTLDVATALCLGFVPASFGYAILKHGAIELNHVVRKSLVYAVLTGAIIAVYYILVNSLGDLLIREFNVTRAALAPVVILVLAIVFAPTREVVQRVVDRMFYRDEFVYKSEVVDFNRQLSRKLTEDEIINYFFQRVSDLLKASYVAIYTRRAEPEHSLLLKRCDGDAGTLQDAFALDSFLGRYFSRYKTPLMVEFLERSWERRNLDDQSAGFLGLERLAVCVPVVAPDRFLGLILLGQKRSGLLYSRADAELLETFAEHLGLVLQNAELMRESLEQERLKSEVMLARDIQLSLLPTTPPEDARIEIHGSMESSFEVGGDYYDFFRLGDDRVAIAIGDVSGKGIPAAMLVSSLQAVFRNLAIKGGRAPAEVNSELNQHLLNHAKTDQFASFFFGVFDLAAATLTFSSAGQCPPLLIKESYVDRLCQGGLLLGVREEATYQEGTVAVAPGDLLFLYTDGVTEQKDDQGAEYGEERLIGFLQANKKLPIANLQRALYESVTAFGNGRQDDDVTTVIAHLKSG